MMYFNLSSKFKILSSIKFNVDTLRNKWLQVRKIIEYKNSIKFDNMPPDSKLIYNLPFAHYLINAYIFGIAPGTIYLVTQVVKWNKKFLSLTEDDLKMPGQNYVSKPIEYYGFLVIIASLVIILLKFTHEWPVRIYRGQNNQYTALFVGKLNPFRATKYNFDEASKSKTLKFVPWHECRHLLGSKKPVGIFDHHVDPPIEYFQMMTPKHLRK